MRDNKSNNLFEVVMNEIIEKSCNDFIELVRKNFEAQSFIRLIITEKRSSINDLKSVTIKPVLIRKGSMLSFVYRYPTKDITKNLSIEDAIEHISVLLRNDFYQALLQSESTEYYFWIKGKKSGIKRKEIQVEVKTDFSHDNIKQRIIVSDNNVYLQELGVLDREFRVKPSMQDKYKQINKYVEIIDGVLKNCLIENSLSVVDMGSGKGYLTFALYDYLSKKMAVDFSVMGVEMRKDLVATCTKVAEKSCYKNLNFVEGNIKETDIGSVDMLIALHACNTATDDAIAQGIRHRSKIIICAPCCHKQIRSEMNPNYPLQNITKYGIFKERQSEIVTDTIRAMILEAFGYKTNVFEFIETEHTPKNVIIVGVLGKYKETPSSEIISKIQDLKALFGIKKHHLETLMNL